MFLNAVFGEVLYSVNCGGDEYIDSKGVIWSKDKDFDGGSAISSGEPRYIRFTQDPYIYLSERQYHDDFTYFLPRLPQGKYVIILKFSEYFSSKNRRMFNISIGSQIIMNNMEAYENIRELAAFDEFIPVIVNEKGLYWNGLHLPDAFKGDKLILKLLKIGNDYPRVSGIMIINGTLENTNFQEHMQKVNRYKLLVKNKQEMSDKPLQFPKEHTVLSPVTVLSVIYKYPLAILIWALVIYIVISKFISG